MELAIYFLKVTISLIVFGFIYQVFLRRLTFFTLNRYYLLLVVIVSFSIPFLDFEIRKYEVVERITPAPDITFKTVPDADHFSEREKAETDDVNWEQLVRTIYYMVATGLFLRLISHFHQIRKQVRQHGIRQGKIWLTVPIKGLNNCSFFNMVFIDAACLPETELNQILAHEREHIKRVHSLDKMMIELLRIIMWFNPVIYYYRNVINEVHEFEVDAAISSSYDKQAYANLLLKLSTPGTFSLSNSFSSNPLKKRIKMLFTNQSKSMKKVIYLAVLPAVFSLVWYLSVDVVYAKIYQSPQSDKATSVRDASIVMMGDKMSDTQVVRRGNMKTQSDTAISTNSIAKIALDNSTDDILSENRIVEGLQETKRSITVVLDPGHGGKDDHTKVNGVYEKSLNLDVALEIRKVLQERGFEVIMTRENDSYVPLFTRAAMKGDVFISIHADRAPLNGRRERYNGMNIYIGNIMPKDPALLDKSTILAKAFQSELGKISGIKMSDEIGQSPSMVLRVNTSPAIIVEMGYMTDKDDLKFMLNKDNHKKMAAAFADAITAYQ